VATPPAAQLVEGLVFDLVGPRRLGVSGVLACVVGLAIMGWALQYPCNGVSEGAFWASALLVFFAAPALALANASYMYILPFNPFAASAVVNSAFCVAQAWGLLGGRLHKEEVGSARVHPPSLPSRGHTTSPLTARDPPSLITVPWAHDLPADCP
jgi:MFS family permease